MRKIWLIVSFIFLQFGLKAQEDSLTVNFMDTLFDRNYYLENLSLITDTCHEEEALSFFCYWLDTPYQYAGNSIEGIDCSGFVKETYRMFFDAELLGGSEHIYNQCDSLGIDDLFEGDLVFFDIYGKGISHVGIYMGEHRFIHASTSKGVIVSNLNEAYYQKRFYAGGRLRQP
jgi:murein DD-endopeptidase / murein LD-carboxypeptidase